MRLFILAATLGLLAEGAAAAPFIGYSATSDLYFDGAATMDYDPVVFGVSIFDPGFLADVTLSADLSTGALTLFDDFAGVVLDGALVSTMLGADNGIGDDSFTMLFSLTTGPQPYAIATFRGDLDGSGSTDFFTDGVFFLDGHLTITGAAEDGVAAIPLPAGVLLMASGLACLTLIGAQRKCAAGS